MSSQGEAMMNLAEGVAKRARSSEGVTSVAAEVPMAVDGEAAEGPVAGGRADGRAGVKTGIFIRMITIGNNPYKERECEANLVKAELLCVMTKPRIF